MSLSAESLSGSLRRLRHTWFAPATNSLAYRWVRRLGLTLLYVVRPHGRSVLVAGRYPLNVTWERGAIDFTTWEREFMLAFGEALHPGAVAFDVGASLGEWSAFAARLVGSDRVHVFEPNAESWRDIRRVFTLNDLARPAGVAVAFVGSAGRDAERILGLPGNGAWPPDVSGASGFESLLSAPKDIPIVTLDEYCAARGVDPAVIKIDVEGAEGCVLRGAQALIRRAQPTILLSLHPWLLPRYGDEAGQIVTWLETQGYTCRLLASTHEEHWLCEPGSEASVISTTRRGAGRA